MREPHTPKHLASLAHAAPGNISWQFQRCNVSAPRSKHCHVSEQDKCCKVTVLGRPQCCKAPPPLPPHHVAPMMANDGLRCKHHCDRFGWTHGRHQVHSAHTNLHTAFSTTEVSEISCIHRKDALSTQCSHRHAYRILCDCGHVRCIYRKDALSTQCSHKPAYRILCY